MVDALALGASSARNGGSSPLPGTNKCKIKMMNNIPLMMFWSNYSLLLSNLRNSKRNRSRLEFFTKKNAFTPETAIDLSDKELKEFCISTDVSLRTEIIKKTIDGKYYYDREAEKELTSKILKVIGITLIIFAVLFFCIIISSVIIYLAPVLLYLITQVGK